MKVEFEKPYDLFEMNFYCRRKDSGRDGEVGLKDPQV